LDLEDYGINLHPGFQDVLINQRVLEVASFNLKTKAGKSYCVLPNQGGISESFKKNSDQGLPSWQNLEVV